jgi:hypothetical protein
MDRSDLEWTTFQHLFLLLACLPACFVSDVALEDAPSLSDHTRNKLLGQVR